MRVSIPGPGGSLGECIVCGQTFLAEILLGTIVQMVEIGGFDRQLPVHNKCLETLQAVMDSGGDWKKLPAGPLRDEFGKASGDADADLQNE